MITSISSLYHKFVKDSRWYKHAGEQNTMEYNYITLGLAGEAGEHADAWKKLFREHGRLAWEMATPEERIHLLNECGDLLYYIQAICIFHGIALEELMAVNIGKLAKRQQANDRHNPLTVEETVEIIQQAQRVEDHVGGPVL